MTESRFFPRLLLTALLACLPLLGGCTVITLADTAASTAIGLTVGTVKTTGKVVGAAIPDGDDEEGKDEKSD